MSTPCTAYWPAPPTGSTLHVSVRRDRILLAKQKPVDSPNAVSGKVRAIEYQGTWVKITLEGASDEEFVVNMPDTEFFVDPVNTGDIVRAHWKAADVHPLVGSSRSDRPYASGQN